MKLKCYALDKNPPPLVPARATREWMDRTPSRFAYHCLPLSIANTHGWEILTPASFSIHWSGGLQQEDVTLEADEPFPNLERFVGSHFTHGIVTFRAGYLFRTEPGWNLVVTGPFNDPKDGIAPLTGVVETDWLPFTFTMNWQFTRPGTVRFRKNEPFCTVFPVARGLLETIQPEILSLESDPELHAQYDVWNEGRRNFLNQTRMDDPKAFEQGWQRHYFKGENAGDHIKKPPAHQTKLRLAQPIDRRQRAPLPLLEETLKHQSDTLGPNHPDTLNTMNNLALGYQAGGEIDRALKLWEEAFELSKKAFGPDHAITFASMNSLAAGYGAAGQFGRALPLYEESLKLRQLKLGPDHPHTVLGMNNLAAAYRGAGKPDRALPLLQEALRLKIAKLGSNHPDALTGMNNLALGYQAVGALDRALTLWEETHELTKATFGANHPDTLISMGNVALGYTAAGQLDRAVPLLEETLALMRAITGPELPSMFDVMRQLAASYLSLKQFDKSATLFEEVLSRKAEKFGREHPETQLTVGNLGVTYKDAGRLAEAIPLLEEVYLSSAAHPNMRWIRPHLLEAYVKAGKTAEAKKFLNEQEKEIRLRLPKESPRLATALVQFSLTLLQLKAYTDAEPILRECLAIRERTQPNEWPAFNARTLLGQALLGQRRYAEAEPLLLQGYEGLKQRENSIPPPYKDRLPKAADQLIDLYAALGKSKDVAVWRAERAKYRVE